MKRIAIVGGGIAGLSAAFRLEQERARGAALEYHLFDNRDRLGGVIRTDRVEGCLVEAGPDSFLSEKPWAAEWCREMGLDDQLVGSNDAGRKTFIVLGRRLVPIPEGLQFMVPTRIGPVVFSPLFSLRSKIRMAMEVFAKPRSRVEDESVGDFVRRHFGQEVVERLADPLLAGVYGGAADRLSLRAVLPRFAEMEARQGSLSRAMLAARRRMAAAGKAAPPLFTTPREGMQQMVEAVAARLAPGAAGPGTAVLSVRRDENQRWLLELAGGGREEFEGVILAVPAYAAAALLAETAPPLSEQLRQIPYSSSVTAALGYDKASIPQATLRKMRGFGFLVPPGQGLRMLACTFVHNKFPHRAPEGRLLLRVFLGGTRDEAVLALDDAAIEKLVRTELHQVLGLETEPRFTRIYRWPRSMAQYEVGHLERAAEIERLAGSFSGLALAGNAYGGIGVPDCVRSGSEAAERLLGELEATG